MVQGVQGDRGGRVGDPPGLPPAVPPSQSPSVAGGPPHSGGPAKPVSVPIVPVDRLQATPPAAGKPLHVVFFSDAHSRMPLIERLVDDVNARHPDLVIDGGDRVHDATAPEFARTDAALARLQAPLVAVEGNHDAHLNGPFPTPPAKPPMFQSFDKQGVHVILLDNSNEELNDEQFRQLEADLEANKGKTTLVALHVPPLLSKERLTTKLSKVAPIKFASPVMTQPDQVARFTALMSRYQVSAVLAGHTHHADQVTRDGVQYIVAGAAGGQTPGMGIANEFLDILVQGRDVSVERVKLNEPTKNPAKWGYEFFRFSSDLNGANHKAIGWSYTPSVSVQLRTGFRVSQTAHGTSLAGAATASFDNTKPKKGAIFAEATLAGGTRELSAEIVGGYKHRLVGDFNRNLHLSGGVGLNGGLIADHLSAGVGARVGAGVEYKNLTFDVGHEFATNRKMSFATVGWRF